MSCDNCGGDPVVISIMDTQEFETNALCADCVPGVTFALAMGANAHMIDEDGRHKWVLAVPEPFHELAAELYARSVFADPEASSPPGGPGQPAQSDGGSSGEGDATEDLPPGDSADVPHVGGLAITQEFPAVVDSGD